MTQFAIVGDEYAPLPSLMWKGEYIHVFGEVWYYNTTHPMGGSASKYPAPNISVRIFATDEQKAEIIITDIDGCFISTLTYEAGQILTITILNDRYEKFIGYKESNDFYLGRFYIQV
jgi:hypothetical protein